MSARLDEHDNGLNQPPSAHRGFLLIGAGGTAREALETYGRFYENDGAPFPQRTVYIDTEPAPCRDADAIIPIGLQPGDIEAIKSDPELFGEIATIMVERYPQYLKAESIRNGSRTVRFNSQLAVEYHQDRIAQALNKCVRDLMRSAGIRQIVPVFFSSTGGGAGSALVVLLAWLFAQPRFRARITEGLDPHTLDVPLAVVTEPFAYAIRHRAKHANKILANACAFRIEAASLDHVNAFQYVFTLGLANDGGAVLDSPEEITRALGTAVYLLAREWDYFKGRAVDTIDSAKDGDRYLGVDVPEWRLPPTVRPPYAANVTPRKPRHRIPLTNGSIPRV
jgi:hypothetical protein